MNKRRRTILVLLIAFLLAIPLLPLSPIQVLADNTGAKYPGTKTTQAVAPEDDVDWTNPANIGADSENAYATAALTYAKYTYRLKAQGFDFSAVPAGATIDGILVEVERKASVANRIRDCYVRLLDASGNIVGNDKATATFYTTSDTIASYGGASDTWGASPTAAMVKDADFGVAFSSWCSYYLGATVSVDYIRVTVYYTVAGFEYSWGYILGA